MSSTLPDRQNTVKTTERTPAGTALTNVLVEVIRLAEFFTQGG
jgi:hypothetical protein